NNYGPGVVYDLGPRCSNRIEGGYLEGNGIAAREDGSPRAWGLVVVGHRNARANAVTSVYLHGSVDQPDAQSVWLTGEEPTGTLMLTDLSFGHQLHAEWPQYAFGGHIYHGLRDWIVGSRPSGV